MARWRAPASLWLALIAAWLVVVDAASATEPIDLIIVAGQSNAVGYDAHPAELPADEADEQIKFWWRTGDPPPDEHDSSGAGRWTHLQSQPRGNPKQPAEGRQYGNFALAEGGFGPEIGLARSLYEREQRPLAVVKVAFNGTSLAHDWNPADRDSQESCYRALVDETRTAIAAAKEQGILLRPRAFAWVQGESDANAEDAPRYAAALQAMIATLRADLDAPELIALVSVNSRFSEGQNTFVPQIVEQQRRFAAGDPRAHYVDTSRATIANQYHFDTAGTLEVGRLMAEALLQVEEKLQPSERHFTIVTLGDSITKGVRQGVSGEQTFAALIEQQLQAADRSSRVINVGIGGERTDQALARLDAIVALRPDIVTVMYGTNDSYIDQDKSAPRLSVGEYRTNLTKIVSELLRRGILPVLMTEPRWADNAAPNGAGENPNVRLEPFVDACRQVAAEWRVPLVDHYADWTAARAEGVALADWTTDACHPNPVGHERLARLIAPVLEECLGDELATRTRLLAGDKVRVVCFGDSVTGVYYHTGSRRAYTDMLGVALERFAPRAEIEMINAGISGHTTKDALNRIDRDVLAHRPDLVTVMFGLNDMMRVPLEEYRANLKAIVERVRASGAEVVLATPNNVVDTEGRPTTRLLEYCDVVRQVGREMQVPVSDCYQAFDARRTHDAIDWRLLMSDAIHPNMDGHKQIAAQLAQSITGVRCSLDDVAPQLPKLAHTRGLLAENKKVQVLAMAPFNKLIASALQRVAPDAMVEVTPWPVAGTDVATIRTDAESRVRAMKPDLVVIAVPRAAGAEDDAAFCDAYAWIMNWSLNFGAPTWDCVVVHPDVFEGQVADDHRDELVRQLVRAQDLHLIDRAPGDTKDAAHVLDNWLAE